MPKTVSTPLTPAEFPVQEDCSGHAEDEPLFDLQDVADLIRKLTGANISVGDLINDAYKDGYMEYLWTQKGLDEVRLDVPMVMDILKKNGVTIKPSEIIADWVDYIAKKYNNDVVSVLDLLMEDGDIKAVFSQKGLDEGIGRNVYNTADDSCDGHEYDDDTVPF